MSNQGSPSPSTISTQEAGDLDTLAELALATTTVTALQISIITFFFYYCALHFYEEVEYIWFKPWSRGKVVYILSRYSGSIFLMLIFAGLLPIRWNEAGRPSDGSFFEEIVLGPCFGGHLFTVAGSVAIFLAQVILAMRTYALYERRKVIVVVSVFLLLLSFAGSQAFGTVYLPYFLQSCMGKPCTFEDISDPYQLVVSCSMFSTTISVIGWVPATIVELVFLVLVLWKVRRLQKIRGGCDIIAAQDTPYSFDIVGTMARDSKKYFLQVFMICLIGMCLNVALILENAKLLRGDNDISVISIGLPIALSNTFVTFAIAALSIVAPNLFISLRMEYYGPVGSLTDQSQLSWDVAVPEIPDTNSEGLRSSQRGEYSVIEDQDHNMVQDEGMAPSH